MVRQDLRARLAVRLLVSVALLTGTAADAVRADTDLTGMWSVQGEVESGNPRFPFLRRWAIVQSDGMLAISRDGVSAPFYTGSIDPVTGTLSFGGVVAQCLSTPVGTDRLTGQVTEDGSRFTASGTVYLNATPTACFPASAEILATRLPCGDGVVDVDVGEVCDDGSLMGTDCCSFTCQLEPNDKPCGDGEPDRICLNGTCTRRGLCGNGELDPGELCDDGNLAARDCCSPTCQVVPDGIACDDGAPVTAYNVCVDGKCATPGGVSEIQVNRYAIGPQRSPAAACAGNGDFAVIWDNGHDTRNSVLVQRYDRDGQVNGGAFQDLFAFHRNVGGRIAAGADGNFLMAWSGLTSNGPVVLARRSPLSSTEPRLQISDPTLHASWPDAAADPAGKVVVVWEQSAEAQSSFTIAARRYDNRGRPLGSEIRVSDSIGHAYFPRVAMDQRGNFVVVWHEGAGVVARRYHRSGVPRGPATQVDRPTQGSNYNHAVAMSYDGSFIVVWTNTEGTIGAQRYGSSGAPLGGRLTMDGSDGSVAMDANGNFIIAHTAADDFGSGVFAQRFAADGVAIDDAFQVNGFTFNDQARPAVCAHPGGDFVIAWESAEQDGSQTGIFVRRFDVADQPPPTPAPALCPGDCDGDEVVAVSELVIGVNVLLGARAVDDCRPVDADDDLRATVDELVSAVQASLRGCRVASR